MYDMGLIYIRCRKVAGTATEIELSKYGSYGDIITPVVERDEYVRRSHGGRAPQNFQNDAGNAIYCGHMSAVEVRGRIGLQRWSAMYSVAVERNPWEKVVSMFFHRFGRRTAAACLAEFVESGEFLNARNFQLYTDKGLPIVSKVLRYEILDRELAALYLRLGIRQTPNLPRVKSQFRPDASACADLYDPLSAKRVAEAFGDEIELMRYEFPQG